MQMSSQFVCVFKEMKIKYFLHFFLLLFYTERRKYIIANASSLLHLKRVPRQSDDAIFNHTVARCEKNFKDEFRSFVFNKLKIYNNYYLVTDYMLIFLILLKKDDTIIK